MTADTSAGWWHLMGLEGRHFGGRLVTLDARDRAALTVELVALVAEAQVAHDELTVSGRRRTSLEVATTAIVHDRHAIATGFLRVTAGAGRVVGDGETTGVGPCMAVRACNVESDRAFHSLGVEVEAVRELRGKAAAALDGWVGAQRCGRQWLDGGRVADQAQRSGNRVERGTVTSSAVARAVVVGAGTTQSGLRAGTRSVAFDTHAGAIPTRPGHRWRQVEVVTEATLFLRLRRSRGGPPARHHTKRCDGEDDDGRTTRHHREATSTPGGRGRSGGAHLGQEASRRRRGKDAAVRA